MRDNRIMQMIWDNLHHQIHLKLHLNNKETIKIKIIPIINKLQNNNKNKHLNNNNKNHYNKLIAKYPINNHRRIVTENPIIITKVPLKTNNSRISSIRNTQISKILKMKIMMSKIMKKKKTIMIHQKKMKKEKWD